MALADIPCDSCEEPAVEEFYVGFSWCAACRTRILAEYRERYTNQLARIAEEWRCRERDLGQETSDPSLLTSQK